MVELNAGRDPNIIPIEVPVKPLTTIGDRDRIPVIDTLWTASWAP